MTRTLSIIELIWIALALVAEGFAMLGFYKWKREDNERKRHKTNGPLEIFYRGKLRLYTLGMLAFFLCLLLSIQNALVPPRTEALRAGYEMVLGRALIYTAPLTVIGVGALFALALILDDRDQTLVDRAHDKKAEQRLLAIETASKIAAERADATDAKADAAFTRADVAEKRADGAATRADIAERRADGAETRADGAETRADVAATRADVAEQRADTAVYAVDNLAPRVDNAEGEITEHTGELTDHTDRLGTLEGAKEHPDG